MNLCIDLNSDQIWRIEQFLVIPPPEVVSATTGMISFYEYKVQTSDSGLINWLCKDRRDVLLFLEDDEVKYHTLQCQALQEAPDLLSVKMWFYWSGTQNMTKDRVDMINHKVLSYKRNQILKNLEL